ncbi:MAG: hypothetical protein M1831_004908 [Alyxoria varia]|nr:MAG: hypothetical protein M1831_004908 [Alyxoria varia]
MAKLDTRTPTLKLNDGTSIPMIAYGTGTAWYKMGEESKIDQALIDSTKKAIETGYYHLDCAEVYKTETEVGTAIKQIGVDRNKLYVVSKVMGGIEDIEAAIKTSLGKLQLDYLDLLSEHMTMLTKFVLMLASFSYIIYDVHLMSRSGSANNQDRSYLIHMPWFAKTDQDLQNAWKVMESIKEKGLTKSIGVSNYYEPHLKATLAAAKIPPAINQIEFNPYLAHPQLVEFHKKHNIAISAYGPLTPITKAAPGPLDTYLGKLSKKHAVSPSELLLRWCIEQDVIPVTTSGKPQRMNDYLRAFAINLTPAETEEISKLGEKKHFRGFWQNKFDENDRS